MSGIANFEDMEAWAKMGLLGADVQVYDLTQVTEFVAEIADAGKEADAPLFVAGPVPADKCVVLLAGYENKSDFIPVYLERAGTGIRCTLLSIRAHNDVMAKMRETAEVLSERLATVGFVPKHLQASVDYLDGNGWLDPSLPQNEVYDEPVFEVGALVAPSEDRGRAGLARMASAACEFMVMPIAATAPGSLPRPMRRRLDKLGKRVRIVNVNITRAVHAGLSRGVASGDPEGRALHFVSGHWRLSPTSVHARPVHGAMKIWIDGFWRGDPAHGVVLHRYLARKRITT